MATVVPNTQTPILPGVLRLPPNIRRRIYVYAGLACWRGAPWAFDLHGGRTVPQVPPSTFCGLLVSCRIIYAEAAALLYEANHFTIRYSGPGSLAPLHALTPPVLASLGRLRIVLNQASCHQPATRFQFPYCCRSACVDRDYGSGAETCEREHAGAHNPPLLRPALHGHGDSDASLAEIHGMLNEWHAAVAYLSSHVRPGHLELALVCDVEPQSEHAVEVAKQAVAPLRLLPLLKACRVRLCSTPDPRLQRLAEDAALQRQASGRASRETKPSPALTGLASLPRELRLRILEYTNLVTPHREVTWSRQKQAYTIRDTMCASDRGFECPPHIHHGCQFSQCWSNRNGLYLVGCFCRRHHAASSPTCKCWVPPGPSLFLICRSLYQDAQYVFFSNNRFIVHDAISKLPAQPPGPHQLGQSDRGSSIACGGYYPYQRLAASIFLRDVVPAHCLAYLRFVELVFPPYNAMFWPQSDEDPAIQDWQTTIEWIRDKITGPVLTLRLIMTDTDFIFRHSAVTDRRAPMVDDVTILNAYWRIAAPLQRLAAGENGIAAFHAHLADPLRWTPSAQYGLGPGTDQDERTLREMTEQRVLGDRYERLCGDASQRKEPPQGIWHGVTYTTYGFLTK